MLILLERLALQVINKPLYRRKCRKKAASGFSSISGLHYVKKFPCLSEEMLLTHLFLQCEVRFWEFSKTSLTTQDVTLKTVIKLPGSSHLLVPSIAKLILKGVFYLMEKECWRERDFSTSTSFYIKSNRVFLRLKVFRKLGALNDA